MKKITIELDEEEIEMLEDYLKYAEPALDSPTIEGAVIAGIFEQILNQTKEEKWNLKKSKKKSNF